MFKLKHSSGARRDLVIAIGAMAAMAVLGSIYDVSEAWYAFSEEHEDWELDELLVAGASGAIAFAWYAYRRWREYSRELARRIAADRRLAAETEVRKRAEQRLYEAQKMEAVGQLTGGIAHDFNNLLAVILGHSEFLADELGKTHQSPQAILRAAERAAELTQRLLAFSRRQPLQPQSSDLPTLLGMMTEKLRRKLAPTVTITVMAAPDLWRVVADPGQLERAVMSLADNAGGAMPKGGKLTIECSNARLGAGDIAEMPDVVVGDYVLLMVTDTGTGMSPAVCARAFDPFFTTKPVGQGSGLGLSMVYGFAKQSGGHVVIDSAEGRGTAVKLYLPRDTAMGASDARDGAASAPAEIPSDVLAG